MENLKGETSRKLWRMELAQWFTKTFFTLPLQDGDPKAQIKLLTERTERLEAEVETWKEKVRVYEEDVVKNKEKVVRNLKSALSKTREELVEKRRAVADMEV